MCLGQAARGVMGIGGLLLATHARALPSATPESAGFSGPRQERISQIFRHDAELPKPPGAGVAAIPGSTGEFMWGGYAGTSWWVDLAEGIVGVYLSRAPGASRQYDRRLFESPMCGALNN